VQIWHAATSRHLCNLALGDSIRPLVGSDDIAPLPLSRLTFTPDGQRVAFAGWRGERLSSRDAWLANVRYSMYDADRGHAVASFNLRMELPRFSAPMLGPVYFRADGRQLATTAPVVTANNGAAERFYVWNCEDGSEPTLEELPWPGHLLGYSADGRTLYATDSFNGGRQIALLDADTWKIRSVRDLPGPIEFQLLQNLVALRVDRELVVYDLDTQRELARLPGLFALRFPFAVSPDGRRLVMDNTRPEARLNGQLAVWSLETGQRLLTLRGPANLGALAFSKDGGRLLARSSDWPGSQPSQVWDATPLAESELP
jgi:hypothetical protein